MEEEMHGNNIPWEGISDFYLFGEKYYVPNCEIVDIKTAYKKYIEDSYGDFSIEPWEETRINILTSNKAEYWDEIFDKAKNYALSAYYNSDKAKLLIKNLNLDEERFINDLPCVGAALERLAWKDWDNRFFNKALNIYNSGFWVCGVNSENFIICGEV